jgi:hypothetical protein
MQQKSSKFVIIGVRPFRKDSAQPTMGKVQASACPFSASGFENSTDLGKAPVATSMEGKGILKRITTDSKRRPKNEKIRRTLNKVGVSTEKVWIPRRIRAACLRSE